LRRAIFIPAAIIFESISTVCDEGPRRVHHQRYYEL
jgi:hypothetical protein